MGRGRVGGTLRFGILISLLCIYWLFLAAAAGFPSVLPVSFLNELPVFLAIVLDVLTSFLAPQILLHLVPVFVALIVSMIIGSSYLSDLFELQSWSIASRYLRAALFGVDYPTLSVDQGELDELDRQNSLLLIGGPGYLKLHLGFAAIFEDIDGRPKVYGPLPDGRTPDTFFIHGFERLRDVVDLRDQLRQVDEVQCETRDGIEVYARDVKMVFRIYGGDQRRKLSTPYPYTASGLRQLVYGQPVLGGGNASKWTDTLPMLLRDEIRNFVSARTIEEFLALEPLKGTVDSSDGLTLPTNKTENGTVFHIPRRSLTQLFHTQGVKDRLKLAGLELDWVGVGTWEIRDQQFAGSGLSPSAPNILTAAWRDVQRIRLYRSPAYLARIREQTSTSYANEVLHGLVRSWNESELPFRAKPFALVLWFRKTLHELLLLVGGGEEPEDLESIQLAIEHIDRISELNRLQEDDF
jgi:hypothetical protein